MATFKIPVTWQMYGHVEVEAENIEDAMDTFNIEQHGYGLPENGSYIDGSFERDVDDVCVEYNRPIRKKKEN